MTIELRTAGSRAVTETDGRRTFHSFSFGAHYDPANVGFSAMTAHNDENLEPGAGYPAHPHAEIEIVTWVVAGALRHEHEDLSTTLGPGEVLRTSAGTGIVHSELAEPGVATRFVQTWLRPDVAGTPPSHQRVSFAGDTGLVEVIGPDGMTVGTAGARLLIGTSAGDLVLPDAPRLHVFVADGAARLGDRRLEAGDAARLTGEGGRTLHSTGATVAVWAFG